MQGDNSPDESKAKIESVGNEPDRLIDLDMTSPSLMGIGDDMPHVQMPERTLVGEVIDNQFKIIEVLGKGGMSVVYKALYLVLNRIVAIKTMHSHLVTDSDALLRFKREAQAASQLDHPNVIKIYGFGITSGENAQPYIVMDYLEGAALSDVIKSHGKLPVPEVLKIFIQVCSALNQAHSKGVIHRDIKPSNIMLVQKDGDPNFVKLVDFGIAKIVATEGESAHRLTQTGDVFGSPLFMSPEQCMGRNVDKRSDVYSLGCVVYEALTGKAPHEGGNVFETFHKHISSIPAPLKIEGVDQVLLDRLDAVVFRALEKDPDKRYQSMADFEADLTAIQNDLATGIRGTSLRHGIAKQQRWFSRLATSTPKLLIFLGMLALLLVTSGAVFWSKCSWFFQDHTFTTPASRWLSYKHPRTSSKMDERKRQALLDKGMAGIEYPQMEYGKDSPKMLNLWRERAEYCHKIDAPVEEFEAREKVLSIFQAMNSPSTLDHASALEAYGYCAVSLSNFRGALKPLEDAEIIREKISLKVPDVYLTLGCIYGRIARITDSLEQLNIAIDLLNSKAGSSDAKTSAIAYAAMGDDYRMTGKWDLANKNYVEAESLLASSEWKAKSVFLSELAMIRAYVDLKREQYKNAALEYAKAMPYLEERFKTTPEELKRVLDGYSFAAWKSGDFLRAVQLHDRSVALGVDENKKLY